MANSLEQAKRYLSAVTTSRDPAVLSHHIAELFFWMPPEGAREYLSELLVSAAAFGTSVAVEALLLAGADANVARAKDGAPAILLAAGRRDEGRGAMVAALLAGGADPLAKNYAGATAVSALQESRDDHIWRMLVEAAGGRVID